MKKLFSVFTAIGTLAIPITGVVGCNPVPDLPYISDNKISENTKRAINEAVLGEINPDSKIQTLFAHDLDRGLKPNFIPKDNIMSANVESADIYEQMQQSIFQLKKINSEEYLPKKSLEYMKKSLLSSHDLISQPGPRVVEKYNGYLDQKSKDKTVSDLMNLVSYFDSGVGEKSDLYNKKRGLYVDQLRSDNVNDGFKDAHSWSLNPEGSHYNEKTKFDQGIFYYVLLNAYLQKMRIDYNVQLSRIGNEENAQNVKENIQNIVSSDIAGINLAFTVGDPEKGTKHFVDGRPVVNSNDNIFENLPILPIEQTIGVKLVIADIYGTVSSYLIGNLVISNLLGFQ